MPVMSASAQTAPVASYDFTVLATCMEPIRPLIWEGSTYGMIAGDVTHNGLLQIQRAGQRPWTDYFRNYQLQHLVEQE